MYTTQTLQPASPGTVLAAHKGVKIYVNRDHELALQDPHDVPGLRKYGRVKTQQRSLVTHCWPAQGSIKWKVGL